MNIISILIDKSSRPDAIPNREENEIYGAVEEDAGAPFVMSPTRWSTSGSKSSFSGTVEEDRAVALERSTTN